MLELGSHVFRVGVAAVVLTGVCLGARADDLYLESVKPAATNKPVLRYGFLRADVDRIAKTVPGVLRVIPFRSMPVIFRHQGSQLAGRLVGTNAGELQYDGHALTHGRYLTENDLEQRHSVAVIGHDVAARLFAKVDPIGKTLRAGDQLFLVVGVARWGTQRGANVVHVPISTMRVRFGDTVVVRQAGTFSMEQYELNAVRVVPQPGVDLSDQREAIFKMLRISRE